MSTPFILFFVNFIFGLSYPLVKQMLDHFNPAEWVFVRQFLSVAVLLLFGLKFFTPFHLTLRDLFWLVLAAFLGIAANQICFVEGLSRTLPAHAAIINATIPLQTLLYSALLLKERLSFNKILGVILGFAGVLILLNIGNGFDVSNVRVRGDGLVVLNTVSYSLFLIVSRFVLRRTEALKMLVWISVFGLFFVGFYAHWRVPAPTLLSLSPKLWLLILYLVVVASLMTYGLNLWALRSVNPSFVALFVYVQPVTAAIFSFYLLGDIPGPRFYASAFLIFLGIVLGSRK